MSRGTGATSVQPVAYAPTAKLSDSDALESAKKLTVPHHTGSEIARFGAITLNFLARYTITALYFQPRKIEP